MLNLLDGLRDLKAPLASGTVMLFAIWLAFANGIAAVQADESLIGNIRRLTEYLGTPATLGIIAFVAYLIGLVLPLHKVVLRYGTLIFNNDATTDAYPFGLALPPDTHKRFMNLVYRVTLEAVERGVAESHVTDVLGPTIGEVIKPWKRLKKAKIGPLKTAWRKGRHFNDYAAEIALAKDVNLLAAQLQTAKEKSYEQYDKAKTEADFRAGLVLPLVLVASIACLRFDQEGRLWVGLSVLAVVVPMVAGLAVTAVLRLREANQILVTALVLGPHRTSGSRGHKGSSSAP